MAQNEIEYKKDTIIFCEFEPSKTCFVILEGQVRITKIINDNEKTLALISKPAIFGEMGIIDKEPRSATAIAETDVKLAVIDESNFYSLLTANPDWGFSIIRLFSKRIFDTQRRIEIISYQDNKIKVFDTVLMLCESAGFIPKSHEEGEIVLDSTKAQTIAHWCGVHVNDCTKHLSTLEVMGKIEFRKDSIAIKDIKYIYEQVKSNSMNKTKPEKKDNSICGLNF